LLVIAPNFAPRTGGVETYIQETGKRNVKDGVKVTVLSPRYGNEPKEQKVDGIKVKRSKRYFSLSNMNFFPGVFFKIRDEDFDIMHLHSPDPIGNISGWFWAKKKNKPYIVTYHADISRKDFFRKLVAPIYEKLFLKRILRDATVVTTTTPLYPKVSVVLRDMDLKTETVPCGFDTKRFHLGLDTEKLRKRLGIEGKKVVMYLGRLNYYKGIQYLIEAFKRVRDKVRDTVLVIAGSGPEEENLRKRAQGMNDVIFTGRVPDSELAEHYSLADVYVLPSIYEAEGFGISLLEAMACGAPVIASDMSGMPFVLDYGKSGLLSKPKDPTDLAEKIAKMLEDEQTREKLKKHARERLESFTWDHTGAKMREIYIKALKTLRV
jgi:rhamnosyl/mannosyltransferase